MATDLKGKRVVLTGGSSGSGLALAELLSNRGARVLIVGRRRERLDEAAAQLGRFGPTVRTFAADVSIGADRTRLLPRQ